jgi:hypothetical protein
MLRIACVVVVSAILAASITWLAAPLVVHLMEVYGG